MLRFTGGVQSGICMLVHQWFLMNNTAHNGYKKKLIFQPGSASITAKGISAELVFCLRFAVKASAKSISEMDMEVVTAFFFKCFIKWFKKIMMFHDKYNRICRGW